MFGCLCYPNLSSTAQHKLYPHSSICIYLSPSSNHHGYRCLDLIILHVNISRHVIFDEDHFPFSDSHNPPVVSDYVPFLSDGSYSHFPSTDQVSVAPSSYSTPDTPTTASSTSPTTSRSPSPSPSTHPMVTRSRTGSFKPKQIFNLSATTNISPIPQSTAQVLCDPNWKSAMDASMPGFTSNHT